MKAMATGYCKKSIENSIILLASNTSFAKMTLVKNNVAFGCRLQKIL